MKGKKFMCLHFYEKQNKKIIDNEIKLNCRWMEEKKLINELLIDFQEINLVIGEQLKLEDVKVFEIADNFIENFIALWIFRI